MVKRDSNRPPISVSRNRTKGNVTPETEHHKNNLEHQGCIYDIFIQLPTCICIVRGPQHIIDFINPAFSQLYGNRPLLHKTAQEGFPELAERGFLAILDQVYASGQAFAEKEIAVQFDRDNDGISEMGYFDFVYQPMHAADGEVIGTLVSTYDVTEQVLLRQSIQKREAHFRALVEDSSDSLFLINADGVVQYASPSIERLLGYHPDEFIASMMSLDIVHPDDYEQMLLTFLRLRDLHGENISQTYRIKHKAGYYCWLDCNGTNLLHKPDVEAIVFHLHDITERKEADRRLMESESRLKRLVDANILGVMFWRLDGQIMEANDVFLNMMGYTRDDLHAGRLNWMQMIAPEYHKLVQQALQDLQTYGTMLKPIEKEYIRHDGERIWVLMSAAFFDASQQEGLGFVLDISHLKEVEQRKDIFIRMASHELKTPLTSIKGFIQILQRHFKQRRDDESLQLLGKVEKQVHRLTQLVNEMLSIAQIDMGMDLAYHLGTFDLRDVVREILDNVRSAYVDKQFSLEAHEPLPVNGDKERIAQVLINLLSNAIKYSPLSKQIVIRTAIQEDSAVVSIQDFGIGIPVEQQQKIFEKFYRVDDESGPLYPGLGVGLFLSSAIIQRHRGRIWVESKEGEGSTFYFSLPLFIMEQS